MLRLFIQTKRKYKKKRRSSSNKKEEVPSGKKDENNENQSDKVTEDDLQEDSNKDQDSDVSFQEEADEEIDATDKEEEWIDFIKRSTEEAEQHMKNTNYLTGLRYTKGQNGGWHEESSLYPSQDGTKEYLNGNQDLTQFFTPKDLLADQKEGGKTISTNSPPPKKKEGQDKAQYELKNNNSLMNEIKDNPKWKENEEWFSKNSRSHFGVEE